MSELIVATDSDFKQLTADKDIAETVGPLLARVYPGYRWRVEPHAHPRLPFVTIRLEHATYVKVWVDKYGIERRKVAPLAYVIKLWQFYSSSSLRAEIMKAGGELLELAKYSRRGFNPVEFLTAPRDHTTGLMVLPTL